VEGEEVIMTLWLLLLLLLLLINVDRGCGSIMYCTGLAGDLECSI
jgi:hypothetical protein